MLTHQELNHHHTTPLTTDLSLPITCFNTASIVHIGKLCAMEIAPAKEGVPQGQHAMWSLTAAVYKL
jgi:hypothetical protein